MRGSDRLLDTNIIIALFAMEQSIIERVKSQRGILSVPIIVIGELFYGAEQSSKRESNIRKIEEFSQDCLIIDCNFETARYYANIKSQLKSKGKPIPENDIWIAALAQQHQQTLITRDRHFDNIDGLLIEKW
jgi:tRNA(fMet)-specific endonuclease VapC